MRKRRKRKPNYTEAQWDLRFGPIRVGSYALTPVGAPRGGTGSVLETYLVSAIREGFLPDAVVLVQFISVPPTHARSIDLRTPAVVRRVPDAENYARGFAVTAHYSLTRKWSFHNKVVELQCPAATMLVFTVGQRAPKSHPFPGVNVIWVDFVSYIGSVSSIHTRLQIPTMTSAGAADLELVPILDIIQEPNNDRVLNQTARPAPAHVITLFYKAGLAGEDQTQVKQFAEELLEKEGYLSHAFASAHEGPVVLASAKKVFFSSRDQNRLIDNSGLTAIFAKGTKLEYSDLESCWRIAHRLSTAFTNLYGIEQAVESARVGAARSALRMMHHSLQNTLIKLRDLFPAAASLASVEEYMLRAAQAYAEQRTSTPDEELIGLCENGSAEPPADDCRAPFARDLSSAFFSRNSALRLDLSAAGKDRVDPRFVGILVELARNLEKHTPSDSTASLSLFRDQAGRLGISVGGAISPSQLAALRTRLLDPRDLDTGRVALRGVPSLLLLIESLAQETARVEMIASTNPKSHPRTAEIVRGRLTVVFREFATAQSQKEDELHEFGLTITWPTTLSH